MQTKSGTVFFVKSPLLKGTIWFNEKENKPKWWCHGQGPYSPDEPKHLITTSLGDMTVFALFNCSWEESFTGNITSASADRGVHHLEHLTQVPLMTQPCLFATYTYF